MKIFSCGLMLTGAILVAGLWPQYANAASASSANYTLLKHAFTPGNPPGSVVPASASYRLAASNIGDLSSPSVSAGERVHYPGYLMPWGMGGGWPNLWRFRFADGRLWLDWEAVSGATSYVLEHASHPDHFTPLAAGLITNRWDFAPTTATSRFYRIQSVTAP
ncbi:MAG TPA: hypothetical protein PKE26_00460 [Kiritimatiellia bacterium]|nr:hypothetical protein [Kiritimatiellia bacterium]HMO97565.1 hypothetical protein [Kiritimatiellia bacterium]HMP95949.1 hypothetical protein [Kiritimatiellia bacterium]